MEGSTCFWSGWAPQKYLYCETQMCGWLQQPANTWSNIGYLIAALLILRSRQKGVEKSFFFWSTFALFLGSTVFHMSGTNVGKLLDVGAMLVLSMGICSLALQRYFHWERRKTQTFYGVGLFFSLLFLAIFDIANIPFSLQILIAATLEFRMIQQKRGKLHGHFLTLALFIEFLAGIALLLDITRKWCDPENHFINGHAVWHLLSAAAIYTLYISRKSET
ncbi:MAG: ceramidase domain-containing protein [Bdellovibrionota bacterium]